MRLSRVLEWAAIAVASLAVAFGAIALLSGFFAGRDQAGVGGAATLPGVAFADLGDAHLSSGQHRPRYNSNPPTSGPHVPSPVTGEDRQLSNDQLLEALELGDVVVMYGTQAPPAGLTTVLSSLAPPFTPALAAAGQAVVIARRPGTNGLTALAWAHMLRVASPHDPMLRSFIDYWLGRGAPAKTTAGP
ncbi:MAG TPA: DUF3105 domain-containing protein [Solirubrobacteraceae bacterium]|nr:DUF3105 domain-containing protein [Solirubrobacteraceae bacterium]